MNTLYKWALLAAMSMTTQLPTQAQRVYTLDECRTMALENNIKIRNAQNDVEAAQHTQKEAFTNYFPNISATGVGYNANKGLVEMEVAPGMSLSMLKNGIMGGVTATQPIFAGGQIVNGNRLAAVGVEASQVQKERAENEVRTTVEQYFWQVVTLQKKLNTLRTVESQLENIRKDVEASVKAGVSTRNDLLQVQLKQNDMTSTRINIENNLTVCRMMLAQYIGADEDSVIVESVIRMDTIPDFPHDIYCDHQSALAQTPEYKLLDINVRASHLEEKTAVGKNLPTVAVGGGVMYDNLMDKSHTFAVGFVTASVPISGWWGGSHSIKKERLQMKNAENQLADNSKLLIIAMQKGWADLQNAYKQMAIAKKSIDQASENLRLNNDYYHAGTTTMSNLLDAETYLQQSRDKYVEAYAQFQIKIVEYLQATGR